MEEFDDTEEMLLVLLTCGCTAEWRGPEGGWRVTLPCGEEMPLRPAFAIMCGMTA